MVPDVRYLHGRNLAPGVKLGDPLIGFTVMALALLDVLCSRDGLSLGSEIENGSNTLIEDRRLS